MKREWARYAEIRTKRFWHIFWGLDAIICLTLHVIPYVNRMAEEGVIPHIVLEKEFDRVLMEETGRDPDHYYPACGIVPRMEYARVIHRRCLW